MSQLPDNSKGIPRWKVIRDWLHAQLPQFAYGSDFFTASELCHKFEVSTITANRALSELANEGLIEKSKAKAMSFAACPRMPPYGLSSLIHM